MALIALVTVVAMADGQRKEFAPGDELPDDLHPHDVAALKAMGSIEDPAETERAARKAAAVEKRAGAEFAEARSQVQAAAESTATGETGKAPKGQKKAADAAAA